MLSYQEKKIICLINNRAAQKCFSTLPTLWINVGSVNVWNLADSLFPYNVSFILIFSISVAVPFRWLLRRRKTEENKTIEYTSITLMKPKLSRVSSCSFVAVKQLCDINQSAGVSPPPRSSKILTFLVLFCWQNVKLSVIRFYGKLKEVPVKLPEQLLYIELAKIANTVQFPLIVP